MTDIRIAIDFETTGLDPVNSEIVEIGAVKFNRKGEILDSFEMLAKPSKGIPPEAEAVHNISNEMVANSEPPLSVWRSFLAWSEGITTYVAHNAKFEARFIKSLYADKLEAELPNINFICTYEVSKNRLRNKDSYKLVDLVDVDDGSSHRALADAKSSANLYQKLAETYSSKRIPDKTYLTHISKYEMFDRPTARQRAYIESLGGDADLMETRSDASNYIDTLKKKGGKNNDKNTPEDTTNKASIFIAIAVLALIVYFVW